RAATDAAAAELRDDLLELLREARLADACRPEHRDEVGHRLGGSPLPGAAENLQLTRPPDEIAGLPPLPGRVQRTDGEPRFHRLRLALGLDRRGRLVLDRVACRRICLA